MSKTIEGIVTAVEKSVFDLRGVPMVKRVISIAHDGISTNVNKFFKPETDFELPIGSKVRATFDEKSGQSKDGTRKFVNNNIIPKGLTVLDVKKENKSMETKVPVVTQSNTTYKSYDATGPIQGMILGKAVDLALAKLSKDGFASNSQICNLIVNSATVILEAKIKTDKLVIKALNEESVEDLSTSQDSEESPFN